MAKHPEESPRRIPYLDLQAAIGATRHMGGLEATNDLVRLCRIGPADHVLDVGCGPGTTARLLAREVGCRVTGVDIRPAMIARASEAARSARLGRRVEFRVADARSLPFEDGAFDAVLCESVATFVEDKPGVVRELVRVAKPGGWIGFNEEVWLQPPPSDEYMAFMRHNMDVEPDLPTARDWEGFLRDAGLQDLEIRVFDHADPGRESSQKLRYSLSDGLRILARSGWLYLVNPAFREYRNLWKQMPKGLFEYLGYGIFVGRKAE
ncbi:MAG: class I SAM-dependent methyltransferase [Chloroflexota bacterium]